MEGKRNATDDTDAHGDGGGASGYGGNAIVISQSPTKGRARSFPPPFLMKTFEMVEAPETNSIISWSPNNASFIIWDQIRFTAELLPKHFRHSNFSSFVYQLNNYVSTLTLLIYCLFCSVPKSLILSYMFQTVE